MLLDRRVAMIPLDLSAHNSKTKIWATVCRKIFQQLRISHFGRKFKWEIFLLAADAQLYHMFSKHNSPIKKVFSIHLFRVPISSGIHPLHKLSDTSEWLTSAHLFSKLGRRIWSLGSSSLFVFFLPFFQSITHSLC